MIAVKNVRVILDVLFRIHSRFSIRSKINDRIRMAPLSILTPNPVHGDDGYEDDNRGINQLVVLRQPVWEIDIEIGFF